MHKADGGCRSRPARITLCRVARESGSAGVPAGISGSSSRASRSSCIDSTNAATWGLRSAGGTAVARARRRCRNSAPGSGPAMAGGEGTAEGGCLTQT